MWMHLMVVSIAVAFEFKSRLWLASFVFCVLVTIESSRF